MTRSTLRLAALLVLASMSCAHRAPPSRSEVPPGSVVFIGAHPDDELYVSPLLERLCKREGRRCVLLMLTRGEQGHCALLGGCAHDLGSIRVGELKASAVRLGASAQTWDLGDVRTASLSEVRKGWEARAGGAAALASRLGEVLEQEKPALVITFDPRHGTTCHPAHRVAGALALSTAAEKGVAASWVIGSQRVMSPAGPNRAAWMGIRPAEPSASRAVLEHAFEDTEWGVVLDVMRIHESQFSPEHLAQVSAAPAWGRGLLLLDGAQVPTDALSEQRFCPGGP